MTARRHVFISHHHADDDHVDALTNLLRKSGADVRNSSIRAKPANQRRLDRGQVSDETIRRLLRMKISWASTVVVLVGRETHARPWVSWEIQEAHRQGKRIVGVFTRGGRDEDVPPELERYGCALKGWNSSGILAAIDGDDSAFELPDGTTRPAIYAGKPIKC